LNRESLGVNPFHAPIKARILNSPLTFTTFHFPDPGLFILKFFEARAGISAKGGCAVAPQAGAEPAQEEHFGRQVLVTDWKR
jgi:hypothetical protein